MFSVFECDFIFWIMFEIFFSFINKPVFNYCWMCSSEFSELSKINVSIILLTFLFIIFSKISLNVKLSLILSYVGIIQFFILIDIKKYLVDLKKIFLSLLLINIANIAYAIGCLMAIFGIKNLINRKFYLKSRQNK